MSVHTLKIQKKKSLSSSNYAKIKFEKVEDRETMEVLSPYLAAFWTIAGLDKHMCQYTVEREQSQVDIIERLRCEMDRKSLPSTSSRPLPIPRKFGVSVPDDQVRCLQNKVSIPFETSRSPFEPRWENIQL